MQVGFDGRAPTVIPEKDHARRDWCVGKRFEYDFNRAPRRTPYGQLRPHRPRQIGARGRAGRPPAPHFVQSVNGAPQHPRAYDLADTRLDATARLGRLADEVSNVSFWMLEYVVGHERSLAEVALMLRTDQRYVAQRFREALTEAAAHYRMGPTAKPRHRSQMAAE